VSARLRLFKLHFPPFSDDISKMQQQRLAAEMARAAAAAAAAAEEEAAAEETRRAQAEAVRQERLQLQQVRPKHMFSHTALTPQQQQLEAELAATLRREFAVLAGVHWRVITSRKVWRRWSR